jgi:hypothetical protein
MEKLKLNSVCLLTKFEKHLFYKEKLLSFFDKEKENIKQIDNYYTDSIDKLDWSKSKDFNRDWVKLIINDLINHFNNCSNFLGYQKALLHNLWFQQYKKNDTHGWHVHGNNYTGVYYVEYDKNCGNTQLVDPFNQNKLIDVKAKEGDIIMFPSTVIHRANVQKNNTRKTIISFNIDFDLIEINTLEKIKKLYNKK